MEGDILVRRVFPGFPFADSVHRALVVPSVVELRLSQQRLPVAEVRSSITETLNCPGIVSVRFMGLDPIASDGYHHGTTLNAPFRAVGPGSPIVLPLGLSFPISPGRYRAVAEVELSWLVMDPPVQDLLVSNEFVVEVVR